MIAKDNADLLIFLAEDSEDDAYFFQRALQKANVGCSLLRAANGKIAIDMLKNAEGDSRRLPFLIFLDLKMPVVNGFEILDWLRSSGIRPVPKVIVLSGSNDHDDRARALRLGAADYLVKPITSDVLRKKVFEALDQNEGEGFNA